jgi:hypothetical protein
MAGHFMAADRLDTSLAALTPFLRDAHRKVTVTLLTAESE